MSKQKNTSVFPIMKIRISMIITAVLFILGGVIIRNQVGLSVFGASVFASVGRYDWAVSVLTGVDENEYPDDYNQGRYEIACAMLRRGDYDKALETFTELGNYADSSGKVCETKQKIVEELIAKGDYKAASAILNEIMYFKGSPDLYRECQYQFALEEIKNGNWLSGAGILWSIKEYKDARELAQKVVRENNGGNAETLLGKGASIPAEIMGDYILLKEKRDALRPGAVAVGFYHTVGLRKDGTVLSAGSNQYGQCETGSWKNVVQIAAGGYHTVGLLRDGTVIACGDNSNGQCDVGEWTDVVQIIATDYNTVALRRDGTVVTCGFNQLIQTQGWTEIERIGGGSYAVCGIDSGRKLTTTHSSCAMDGDFVDVSASISYAAGLDCAGNIVYSSETPTDWKKAAAVFAGCDAVGIIDFDYKPSIYDRRHAVYADLPSAGKALDMSLGGTHFAVLYDDGSVYCKGLNDAGQCDTSGWNLN